VLAKALISKERKVGVNMEKIHNPKRVLNYLLAKTCILLAAIVGSHNQLNSGAFFFTPPSQIHGTNVEMIALMMMNH